MALDQADVDIAVERAFDRLFEDLDDAREDMKPSQLERMLDKANWGLGDDYREWYELSGDAYE